MPCDIADVNLVCVGLFFLTEKWGNGYGVINYLDILLFISTISAYFNVNKQ